MPSGVHHGQDTVPMQAVPLTTLRVCPMTDSRVTEEEPGAQRRQEPPKTTQPSSQDLLCLGFAPTAFTVHLLGFAPTAFTVHLTGLSGSRGLYE